MLRAGDRNSWTRGIQAGFSLSLAVFSVCASASAKSVTAAPFPFTPPKKAAQLNYPPLPIEIAERIQGVKKKTTGHQGESALTRDWALASIGFFDVFSSMASSAASATIAKTSPAETCGNEVVVAVIDTGIDYTHNDLKDNLWVNSGETGAWEPPAELRAQGITCRDKSCNGIDDDGNGYVDDVVGWDFVHDVPLPYDTHGHGTHISGIITASSASTSFGASPGCPRAMIMPLKYYDNSGAGYNNLANTVRAIHYAVRNGAHIINYSGGGADPASAEKAAIEEASKKGILFVAAAGNDGHNNDQVPYFPASYGLDNIIGVASINKQNQLLPSSNWGKTVQVGAPGLMVLSTLPEGKFGTMSGTSQATAFVTGAAALLESQMKHRSVTDYRRVKHWIVESTKPLKGNEKRTILSGGLLSLPKAVAMQKDDLKKGAPALAPAPELAQRPNTRGAQLR